MTENGLEVCPHCGGLGAVVRDVPVGHPDFGKAFPCICQAEKIKARHSAYLRKLGNLDAYKDKTFASFEIDHSLIDSETAKPLLDTCPDMSRKSGLSEEQRRAVNSSAEIAFDYANDPKGWLLFQGGYGTGKTHLAAAIANWRLDHHEPVLFVTVPDLLDHLRVTYGPASEVAYDERFEQFRSVPVLILDDLGAESPTPWAQEKLYQLFNDRYVTRLPTVVTTNVDPETFDPRILSRLTARDLIRVIQLDIPDQRSAYATWQEQDLTSLVRYRAMSFDTFEARHDLPAEEIKRLERTVETARAFAENPIGWLVLTGENGCGKTHLAAAIAQLAQRRQREEGGELTMFVTAPELLNYLRETFAVPGSASYDERLEKLKRAPVLIFDDLTINDSLSSWARNRLYEILLYRFDYGLPTVITTYLPLDQIDPRLRSRLINKSRSVVLAITAPAYPGKGNVRRAAAARGGRESGG